MLFIKTHSEKGEIMPIPFLQTVKNLTYRFNHGGFEQMGFVQHPKDTRTAEQINNNLEIYAKQIPEVQKFIEDLKKLSPENKALVSDVVERANENLLLMTDIDLKHKINGQSILEKLLGDIIAAEKTTPESLNFLKTIINNTDSHTAKYALAEMSGGILKNKEVAKQFEASQEAVPLIAKQTLNGGYLGTFEKQKNFMDFIKVLINPKSKPENIKLIQDVQKTVDNLENAEQVYLDTFVRADVPVEKLKENIKTLPIAADLFKKAGKNLDTTGYLTNNTNLY